MHTHLHTHMPHATCHMPHAHAQVASACPSHEQYTDCASRPPPGELHPACAWLNVNRQTDCNVPCVRSRAQSLCSAPLVIAAQSAPLPDSLPPTHALGRSPPSTSTIHTSGAPPATCGMPHAACHMPHATDRMPFVICRMPYATCHMPHAICHMPYAICRMPHTVHMRMCMCVTHVQQFLHIHDPHK